MDDITDLPFRQICKEMGADMLITEFIASEALNRDAEKSLRKMRFSPEQRPIGIQIFGADEDELLRCLEVVDQASCRIYLKCLESLVLWSNMPTCR